jgi:hypothetical protein
MTADNPYEKQHRFKKATEIVNFIEKSDMSIEQVTKMGPKERAIIASLANVKTPSEETWNLVTELYTKRKTNPLVS